LDNFLEHKIKDLILESTNLTTNFYTAMLEEAFDKAEKKKL